MKKDEDLKLGNKIKVIRLGRNIHNKAYNQKDFSKMINATVQALSNWENGRNQPNTARLQAIADLAGISVDELLKEDLSQYARNRINNLKEELTNKQIDNKWIDAIIFAVSSPFFNSYVSLEDVVSSKDDFDKKFESFKKEAIENILDPQKRGGYLLGELEANIYQSIEHYEDYFYICNEDTYYWKKQDEDMNLDLLNDVGRLKSDLIDIFQYIQQKHANDYKARYIPRFNKDKSIVVEAIEDREAQAKAQETDLPHINIISAKDIKPNTPE